MNHQEACALIDRVFSRLYSETDNWADSNIGMQLAYLAWEIAQGDCDRVDWHVSDAQPILALFEKLFAENDVVWRFIDRPVVRHFIVVGRKPRCLEPPTVAYVAAHSARLAAKKFGEGWLYEGEQLPPDWYLVGEDPETKEPWMIIEGLVEINEAPKMIIVDHETDDL